MKNGITKPPLQKGGWGFQKTGLERADILKDQREKPKDCRTENTKGLGVGVIFFFFISYPYLSL